MASLNQGDCSNQGLDTNATRQALFNRLHERHEQLRIAQRQRAQQNQQRMQGSAQSERMLDFLPRFLLEKSAILSDLDAACAKLSNSSQATSDLTKLIDDSVLRMEKMQKSLNEASLYLTSFDLEQARLELKDLNNQFQLKREILLPTKKFSFSRKPKSVVKTSPQLPKQEPVHPPPVNESLCSFDPDFSLVSLSDQTLVLPKSADASSDALGGQSIYLADLTNCIIYVNGVCGNLIARRLHQCRLYTYPVAGSVWVEDCHACDLILACRQLRIHQTTDCRLGLQMASRPIIEHSTGLVVAPYPLQHDGLSAQMELAGLTSDVNLWREVEDFSHPNKRLTSGSPNWSILPESDWPSLHPPVS